jgi:hypothetical protein
MYYCGWLCIPTKQENTGGKEKKRKSVSSLDVGRTFFFPLLPLRVVSPGIAKLQKEVRREECDRARQHAG